MIALEFTPIEESQIFDAARQSGLAPAAYLKRLVQEHLPAAPFSATPAIDAENAAAIAGLQAYLQEDATNDLEEVRQAEEELVQLTESLNRNRLESGERPLFP